MDEPGFQPLVFRMDHPQWHTDVAAGQVPGVLLGLLLGVLLAVALAALVLIAAPAARLLDERRPDAQALASSLSVSRTPPRAPLEPEGPTFLP